MFFKTESYEQASVSSFVSRVYGWMTLALALTAGVAYYVSLNPVLVRALFSSKLILFGFMLISLALVTGITALVSVVRYNTLVLMYLAYATLLGFMFSGIFAAYSLGTLGSVFLITAGTFGAMAIYGYVTKTDLSSMGSLLIMLLWGCILASIVNIWVVNDSFSLIISYISVFIFVGLTAYDMQKIRQIAQQQEYVVDPEMSKKLTVFCALNIYLDFVNLFLSLLRILGNRRNK